MEQVSQGWLVHSNSVEAIATVWTGRLWFAAVIPMTALALPMGVVADRSDKRKLLLLFQILLCAAAALQAIACHFGWTQPWMTVSIAFVEGICAGATVPVWHGLVPQLVPREDLPGAIALNSAQFNVARAVGPMLAGIAIDRWGMATAFDLNVASFGLLLFALVVIRLDSIPRAHARRDLLAELKEGLDTAYGHRGIFRLIWTGSVFVFFTAPIFALLPALAERNLGGEARTYASLVSALGIGAVVGALLLGWISTWFTRQRAMAVSAFLGAGALVVLASTNEVWTARGLMFCFGVSWCVLLTTQNTALQMLVPDAVRARVMSINTLAFVAMPIGCLVFGWLARPDVMDVTGAVRILGLGALAVGILHTVSVVPAIEGSVLAETEPVLVKA
jgi:MFS family permease